jgi:hypothetical protein
MKCCSCVYRNGSNGGARGGKLKAEPAEGLTTESLPHRTFAGGLRRHGQERGAYRRCTIAKRGGRGSRSWNSASRATLGRFRTSDRRNRRVEASALRVRTRTRRFRYRLARIARGARGASLPFPQALAQGLSKLRHWKQIGTSIALRKSLAPLAHHRPARSPFAAMHVRTDAARR